VVDKTRDGVARGASSGDEANRRVSRYTGRIMSSDSETRIRQETNRRVRAVRIAIVASFGVGVVEVALAWFLGLESLLAEGIHTLLDGVDSIIVLFSVLLAAKPADRSHQFGHGKFEAVGAAIEATFVACAAVGIGYRAIDRLIRHQAPDAIPGFVWITMVAAAVFYFFVSLHLMREARATKSPAILAEALHLRTHVFVTGGLAAGLLIGTLGDWPIADTLLALGVAVCLIAIAGHIFREVFAQFTDASLPPAEMEILGRTIDAFNESFVEVHGIRTRQAGAERHIEMHLVVDPATTVADAHDLSHRIEAAVSDRWPTARTTVHIEPLNVDALNHASWLEGEPRVRTDDDSPDEREFIH